MNLSLEFGWDKVPPPHEDKKCRVCGEPIIATAYYPYFQMGDAKTAKTYDPFCERCYLACWWPKK